MTGRTITDNPLIYVLDAGGLEEAADWVELLREAVGAFKIGFQLFLREGPRAVETVHEAGCKVFLDLKFYDIPHTVEKAAREAVRMGVFMCNVHALGGRAMMAAAVRGAVEESKRLGVEAPKILGVTVLTSLDEEMLSEVGIQGDPGERALSLAGLAHESGLSGVVASPREVLAIKDRLGRDFLVVCPGIRPAGAEADDQVRIETPRQAVASGADYLVVGRPIREARDPVAAAKVILADALRGAASRSE